VPGGEPEATHEVGSGALYVNDYILWRW
jgi:hypothetical protein